MLRIWRKVICSGIPINKMGNLKKMSASILAKHFSQKRFSRQRINNILNHKFPVERFDLITLEFFVISQEMAEDDPYTRYRHFLEEIQEILARCEMSEIYIVNPYECFPSDVPADRLSAGSIFRDLGKIL